MDLQWIHEMPGHWDADKSAVLGAAPSGSIPMPRYAEGQVLPGEWYRVEEAGMVVGYGWMDETWGEALVVVAVAPAAQGRGVGRFVVERLEAEARKRGFRYVYNVVPDSHPDAASVTAWLKRRGFQASEDGRQLRKTLK